MEQHDRTDTQWQWRIAKPQFFNAKAWKERVVRASRQCAHALRSQCFVQVSKQATMSAAHYALGIALIYVVSFGVIMPLADPQDLNLFTFLTSFANMVAGMPAALASAQPSLPTAAFGPLFVMFSIVGAVRAVYDCLFVLCHVAAMFLHHTIPRWEATSAMELSSPPAKRGGWSAWSASWACCQCLFSSPFSCR